VSTSKVGNLVGSKTPEEKVLIDLLTSEVAVFRFHHNFRKVWQPDFMGEEETEHFQNYHGPTERDDI